MLPLDDRCDSQLARAHEASSATSYAFRPVGSLFFRVTRRRPMLCRW